MRIVIRNPADFWFGLFVIGLASIVYSSSAMSGDTEVLDMGPSNLPRLIAVAAMILGLATFIQAFVVVPEPLSERTARPIAWQAMCVTVAAFAFVAFSIQRWGLFTAAFGLTLISSLATSESRWGEVIAFSFALAMFVVLIFVVVLNRPMLILPGWLGL